MAFNGISPLLQGWEGTYALNPIDVLSYSEVEDMPVTDDTVPYELTTNRR